LADDLGGDVTRRPAQLLGQRKGGVGLEVAERGRADQRVRVSVIRAVRGHQGIAHPRAENLLRICHGPSLVFPVLYSDQVFCCGPCARSRSRRRKWAARRSAAGPIRSLIFSVMSPRDRLAASAQAAVTARAVDAPCAITTVPPRPSSAAPP